MAQINKLRPSAWTFDTSSGGGLAGGPWWQVGGTGGKLFFKDPSGGAKSFWYGGAGAGLGYGLKVKGKSLPGGGTYAPKSWPNTGKLYCTNNLSAAEATESDLKGPCTIIEASGGVIGGGSGTMMCLGCNAAYLLALGVPAVGVAIAFEELSQSAKVLLFMAGFNVGIQAGVAVLGYAGYLT